VLGVLCWCRARVLVRKTGYIKLHSRYIMQTTQQTRATREGARREGRAFATHALLRTAHCAPCTGVVLNMRAPVLLELTHVIVLRCGRSTRVSGVLAYVARVLD